MAEPPASSISPSPRVERTSQQVCDQFATSYLAVDTTKDQDESAARIRATATDGTPTLQQDIATSQTRPTAQWREWVAHRARIETRPQPYVGDQPPPDTPQERYRAVTVEATAVGDDGWRSPLAPTVVYCTLRPTGTAWLVDDVEISVSETR